MCGFLTNAFLEAAVKMAQTVFFFFFSVCSVFGKKGFLALVITPGNPGKVLPGKFRERLGTLKKELSELTLNITCEICKIRPTIHLF
jgi:hypothetical protein